jgi:hypothetical protein
MSNVTRFPGSPLLKEDIHNAVDDLDTCFVVGWKGDEIRLLTMEPDVASVNLWLDMAKDMLIEGVRGV